LFIDARELTGFIRCVFKKYMIVDRSVEYLREVAMDYVLLLNWMKLKELRRHKASFRIPVAPKSTRSPQLQAQVLLKWFTPYSSNLPPEVSSVSVRVVHPPQ